MKINKNSKQHAYRVNEDMPYSKNDMVRIVGENIESSVMSFYDATKLAEKMGLDLIEINSNPTQPIIRLAAYDKFLYEQKKVAKKNKPNNKPLKEIDLSVNIAHNDLETKARKAKEFIEDGSKVKVVLTMRGRELSRREVSKKSILEFIDMMGEVAVPETMPKDEGNKAFVILKKK